MRARLASKGMALGLLVAAAVLGIGLGLAFSRQAQTQVGGVPGFAYAAKVVCGTVPPSAGAAVAAPLLPGLYSSAINIHNPQAVEVTVFKKAVLSPREPASGKPGEFIRHKIPPDLAFEIDCPDVYRLLGTTAPVELGPLGSGPCNDGVDNDFDGLTDAFDPDCFIKGFAVVYTPEQLDVWGVYTSGEILDGGTAGNGISEDIEAVPFTNQTLPPPCTPSGPNFDTDGPGYGIGAGIGNGASVPGHDGTVANADADTDNCDLDDDNDGYDDADLSETDPRGDITYDDDGDGRPACLNGNGDGDCNDAGEIKCLGGTDDDGSDDGPSWDTDCNAKRDGVQATCTASLADTDGDGLKDAWEECKWGTNPNVIDTDGDLRGDCKEAADENGDGVVDFVGDTIHYAKAALLPAGIGPNQFGKDGDFDINGDNVIDFVGDAITEAQFALIAGRCK